MPNPPLALPVVHPQIQALIVDAAHIHALPPSLILAQVRVESGGNPWAWNPEPQYRYFWDVKLKRPFREVTRMEVGFKYPPPDFPAPPGVDPDAEWWGQSASWGLMQIMGAVAREIGFSHAFLTQLMDPATNLNFGCDKMLRLMKRNRGNTHAALAQYNGGLAGNDAAPFRNQSYVDKVMRYVNAAQAQA